jgi:membrane protein DedA with SNARE-associated domain
VLIVASVVAGTKHDLNIVSVILTAGGAAIIGRMIGYVFGREFGYWLLLRYGGYLWITESRIKLGQYLFLRHGGKIIFIAQFIPV